jgi:hypothetical protein
MPIMPTRLPVNRPMTTPVTMAAATETYHGAPASASSLAITAAQTPLTTPADRSISPRSRMNTSPIARMMIGAAWSARLAMFRGVRNVSGRSAKNSRPRATMPRMAGSAPRSPPRTRST